MSKKELKSTIENSKETAAEISTEALKDAAGGYSTVTGAPQLIITAEQFAAAGITVKAGEASACEYSFQGKKISKEEAERIAAESLRCVIV